MKISKKFIITICSAIIIISCYIFTFTLLKTDVTPKETPKITETPPVHYIVKQYNNRIAIFVSGNNEPLEILDSPFVRDLPEYDQQLLLKGIIVKTNEELLKVLEDYDN